jgi:hypothetical protein
LDSWIEIGAITHGWLTSTEPFIWEDLSRDAEKSDCEAREDTDGKVNQSQECGQRFGSSGLKAMAVQNANDFHFTIKK